MNHLDECVLCKAFAEEKSRIVFEDEFVFAIMNLHALKDGHLMVLPIRHVETLADLDEKEAKSFLNLTQKCMEIIEKTYGGTTISMVNGWKHRSEPHLHLHIVTSKKNLRGLMVASEGVKHCQEAECKKLEEIAEKLRKAFN